MRTNLQKLRKAAGYRSANEFADAAGIPRKTYEKYEQGTRSMSLEVAWRICDRLGCGIQELVDGLEVPDAG